MSSLPHHCLWFLTDGFLSSLLLFMARLKVLPHLRNFVLLEAGFCYIPLKMSGLALAGSSIIGKSVQPFLTLQLLSVSRDGLELSAHGVHRTAAVWPLLLFTVTSLCSRWKSSNFGLFPLKTCSLALSPPMNTDQLQIKDPGGSYWDPRRWVTAGQLSGCWRIFYSLQSCQGPHLSQGSRTPRVSLGSSGAHV